MYFTEKMSFKPFVKFSKTETKIIFGSIRQKFEREFTVLRYCQSEKYLKQYLGKT